jgi:hypothetical protein
VNEARADPIVPFTALDAGAIDPEVEMEFRCGFTPEPEDGKVAGTGKWLILRERQAAAIREPTEEVPIGCRPQMGWVGVIVVLLRINSEGELVQVTILPSNPRMRQGYPRDSRARTKA